MPWEPVSSIVLDSVYFELHSAIRSSACVIAQKSTDHGCYSSPPHWYICIMVQVFNLFNLHKSYPCIWVVHFRQTQKYRRHLCIHSFDVQEYHVNMLSETVQHRRVFYPTSSNPQKKLCFNKSKVNGNVVLTKSQRDKGSPSISSEWMLTHCCRLLPKTQKGPLSPSRTRVCSYRVCKRVSWTLFLHMDPDFLFCFDVKNGLHCFTDLLIREKSKYVSLPCGFNHPL